MTSSWRLLALLAPMALILTGCSQAPPDDLHAAPVTPYVPNIQQGGGAVNGTSPAGSHYTIRRGDKLTVYFTGVPRTVNNEFPVKVNDRGFIALEFIPPVRIDGLTPTAAGSKIEQAYVSRQLYPNLQVTVLAQDAEFYVHGAVMRSGRFPLAGNISLLQALSIAGGRGKFAGKHVEIHRKTGDIERHALKELERGDIPDPLIQPGDRIFIPKNPF